MFGFNKRTKDVDKGLPIPAPPILIGSEVFYPATGNKAAEYALLSMYKELPELQIPLNYVVDSVAGVRLVHSRIVRDKKIALDNSAVLKVLNKPNQWDKTYSQFAKNYMLNRLLFGVGYINRIETTEFGVSQLYVLPSNSTKSYISGDSTDIRLANISKYTTDFGGGKLELKADEVVSDFETILDKVVQGGSVQAYSRLESIVLASKSLKAIYEAKVKMYEDRGALGLITPKESGAMLDKTASDNLKAAYYKNNGITGTKAPFMIGSVALDYTAVTFNAKDLMLNENRMQDFNMVCAMLGIDPVVFGLSPATYANKEWSSVNMWNDTIMPIVASWTETLKEVFRLPDEEILDGDFKNIAVLQAAKLKTVDAYSKMLSDGVINTEEYRQALNIL